MRTTWILGVVGLLVSSRAHAEGTREGATIEMSIGGAALVARDGASVAQGLAFNLGAGRFATPRVAISLR